VVLRNELLKKILHILRSKSPLSPLFLVVGCLRVHPFGRGFITGAGQGILACVHLSGGHTAAFTPQLAIFRCFGRGLEAPITWIVYPPWNRLIL
jgi:hypothetical protein